MGFDCLQLMSKIFLILRRIQRDIIVCVFTSACILLYIFVIYINYNFNFVERIWKSSKITNFKKVRSVAAESFHAKGRTVTQTDKQTRRSQQSLFANFAKAPIICSYIKDKLDGSHPVVWHYKHIYFHAIHNINKTHNIKCYNLMVLGRNMQPRTIKL